ncbi:hypothetical protein KJ966_20270 [bacterium]|nr:hypothetical protein [bacterium]
MKYNKISTPWKESVDTSLPLPEYPRPQMVRQEWISLNGIWTYSITSKDSKIPECFTEDILVPFAPETELSGVMRALKPDERLWYQRTFSLPEDWYSKRVVLHFEAVDWQCACFVNGQLLGEHTGGYISFSFDLTEVLQKGENEIVLSVWDPTDSHWQQVGKQVLNPDKIYYTATSGIWQTVWLEAVAIENHILDLKLTPDPASKCLEVAVKSRVAEECNIIVFAEGQEIQTVKGLTNQPVRLSIPNPRLWSPEDPFLYDVAVQLFDKELLIDEVKSYFGIRSVSIRKSLSGHRRIYINDSPCFLHGPLDQGYWPESGMTPPCEEALLFDLRKIKEMGFNMVRKHVKVETRRWYYHADRLGLVVVQDMINGGKNMAGDLETSLIIALGGPHKRDNTPKAYLKAGREIVESRKDFERELLEMMDHLHNHPSLMVWVPFNESWGQFDSKRIAKLMREHDPTRLIDHASGWYDQGVGDFRSRHRYVLKLKKPPSKDKRVYFLSEYGGYSLICKNHLWDPDRDFKYKTYKSREQLEQAYRNLIRKQVIPLIPKGLGAAIYTQLSDVEIECNGLFTYDRKIQKIDSDLVHSLNEELYAAFIKVETQ